jgi:hypothetical protein
MHTHTYTHKTGSHKHRFIPHGLTYVEKNNYSNYRLINTRVQTFSTKHTNHLKIMGTRRVQLSSILRIYQCPGYRTKFSCHSDLPTGNGALLD